MTGKTLTIDSLSIRNQAEIERSASEAGKIYMESIRPAEIDRYINLQRTRLSRLSMLLTYSETSEAARSSCGA